MKEHLIELLLTWLDKFLDLISLGYWSEWQGDQRVVILRGDKE